MTTITRKAIVAINAKCKNGFYFNIRTFQERGEKSLVKTITVREERKIVMNQLYWVDEVIRKKNEHGVSVPKHTGNVIPQIIVSIWTRKKAEKCWLSYGVGQHHRFNEHPCNKRLMNKLCEVTEHITDELIRSLLPEHEREECMPTNNNDQ